MIGLNTHQGCETKECASVETAEDSINLEVSCSSYSNPIYLAYCMVLECIDIAYDAFMYYGHSTGDFEDYLYRLTGYYVIFGQAIRWRYDVYCDWLGCPPTGEGPASSPLPHLQRNIRFNKDYIKTLYLRYREVPDDESKARYCLLSGYAVVIFHEICHGALECGRGEETAIVRLQNYFQYFLLKRYCLLGYLDTGYSPIIRCSWGDNWNLLVCNQDYTQDKHDSLTCEES